MDMNIKNKDKTNKANNIFKPLISSLLSSGKHEIVSLPIFRKNPVSRHFLWIKKSLYMHFWHFKDGCDAIVEKWGSSAKENRNSKWIINFVSQSDLNDVYQFLNAINFSIFYS